MSSIFKKLSPEKMLRRNSNKSATDNDIDNGSVGNSRQDGGPQPSGSDNQTTKSTKNVKKTKSKGKAVDESADEMYECEECRKEVDMLVECECCSKWLCVVCAKISNKVMKMLLHYKAISFYCATCKPVVKDMIDTQAKGNHSPNNANISEVEKKLLNIVTDVENKVKELMEFKDKLTQENEKVSMTYSSIVKGIKDNNAKDLSPPFPPLTTATDIITSQPTNIIDEYNDRERRKNNLIFTGIKESVNKDPEIRKQEDRDVIGNIFKSIEAKDVVINKIIRLGAKKEINEKPRLLLVSFEDIRKKRFILTQAKKLRDLKEWDSIFISPDLTRKEQEEGKKLRDQLRALREQGHTDYIIKRGMIVKNPKKPTDEKEKIPTPDITTEVGGQSPKPTGSKTD